MPSSKKDINQQLYEAIYAKVIKKEHKYPSPQKGDGTIKKCIELFEKGADPNVLIRLEESLRGQEEYHGYYIKNFLPILKDEVIKSEALAVSTVFGNGIEQSQRPQTKRGKIVKTILDITNRSSDKDSKIEEQPINSIKEEIPVSSTGMTENNVESPTEEVCASDSDSGIDSPRKSEESLESPISSRRSSMSSILSSAGEGNDPVLSEQIAEKKPQVQENENSDGQEGKIPSQVKGELKSNDKEPELALLEEQKKEAVLSKQEASNKENNSEVKQPNNRNLHVALVAGCALSTIGCIVAGAMTSGLVGAGLLAMAAVFAIAAVAELYSNFLSSKLTSINVSPLVDDKELTACSHL
ncbi:hypothetical protein [Wolbachia endosymbiont of Psylliodes chrysocephala]|uniref:hypothetical protein n=1 Tax=Wolbachia endosymbiont of Psylliodes chrysocephala TaxID=2883236 RepID=UPI0020A09944|nr:hypothetical protein [Wolbachia endosymbiont of Psylliodes chrysocephala]